MFRFLRFRDEVSLHFLGHTETIIQCIQIVSSGYPECMIFNMETKLIFGESLNIRIYKDPTSSPPLTSLLRKPNNKYNITPANSNTHVKYKERLGMGIFGPLEPTLPQLGNSGTSTQSRESHTPSKGFRRRSSAWACAAQRANPIKGGSSLKLLIMRSLLPTVSSTHSLETAGVHLEKFYLPMEVPTKTKE